MNVVLVVGTESTEAQVVDSLTVLSRGGAASALIPSRSRPAINKEMQSIGKDSVEEKRDRAGQDSQEKRRITCSSGRP